MAFEGSAGMAPSFVPKDPITPTVVYVKEILGSGTYTPLVQQGVPHTMTCKPNGPTRIEVENGQYTRDRLKSLLAQMGLTPLE